MGKVRSEYAEVSERVLNRIKNTIMPDGAARVSDLVENAQCKVLFGKFPEGWRREESIMDMLWKDLDKRHHSRINRAVNSWRQYHKDEEKDFTDCYDDPGFRDFYLVRYFSENVLKLQLILLKLLELRKLPIALDVLDIGVGTGATAIAVLDFLRIWAECSKQAFPIEDVRLVGVDRNPKAFDLADDVIQAYADALQVHSEGRIDYATGRSLSKVYEWAAGGMERYRADLNGHNPGVGGANLIVASNVLTELCRQSYAEENFNGTVGGLPNRGLAIIIELSDGRETTDSGFGDWHSQFLDSHPKKSRQKSKFKVVLENRKCIQFNRHTLYLKFHQQRGEKGNSKLQWRHIVLQKLIRQKEAVDMVRSKRIGLGVTR